MWDTSSNSASAKADDLAFDPYKADRHRLDLQQSLKEAEPALREAEQALHTLEKWGITELRKLMSPQKEVKQVLEAVIILFDHTNQIPKDRSWGVAIKLMGDAGRFLTSLLTFDKDGAATSAWYMEKISYIEKYLSDVTVEKVKAISTAAAGLCSWVYALCRYTRIAQRVLPMKAELDRIDASNPIE